MHISQDFEVSAGRKRATGDTAQLAVPLGRITTGWACQIHFAALFQTMAVRTKVPDHGELFSARRWSGKVGRNEPDMPTQSLYVRAGLLAVSCPQPRVFVRS